MFRNLLMHGAIAGIALTMAAMACTHVGGWGVKYAAADTLATPTAQLVATPEAHAIKARLTPEPTRSAAMERDGQIGA
jgi:hypothetical protein